MGNSIKISLLLVLMLGDASAEGKKPQIDECFKSTGDIPNCSDCHGADGNSLNSIWPNLAGLDKRYILKQLSDFKAGRRISCEMNGVMRDIPSDSAILEELADYFSSQTLVAPKKEKYQNNKLIDLTLGKEIYIGKRMDYGIPACSACHDKSKGSDEGKYPRLIGQHRKYIVKQMKLFRDHKRSNDVPAMMQNITRVMDDEDIESVAAYIETLSSTR